VEKYQENPTAFFRNFDPQIYTVWNFAKLGVTDEGAGNYIKEYQKNDTWHKIGIFPTHATLFPRSLMPLQLPITMWAMWLACHTQAEIAERVGVTEQVIGQFLQESKVKFSENQTLLFCNFDPQIYTVWNFAKLTNKTRVFGSIPQEIIDNLLYFYTNPFDVVFDPFAGGGSTIDKCIERKRRYYASDLSPIVARGDGVRLSKFDNSAIS